MKRRHNFSKILIGGLLLLLLTTTFAQSQIDKTTNSIIESLLKDGIDTVIEVRVKNELKHHTSTYIYYENKQGFHYKFCAKKVDKNGSVSECNNDWQTIFYLISTQWDRIKSEKILADTTTYSDGSISWSSPSKYTIYEIKLKTYNNTDSLDIRADYFLPTENKHFANNILTTTFLLLTLMEKYNNEIDRKSNR